ncbi:hypothetical protein D3C80_1345000 [compost metagenome]
MPSVVADQHGHATAPRRLHQRTDFIQVHAHRFFQQHRHTGLDAIERGGHMQVIGVGDDHRLGLDYLQHAAVVGKTRHRAFGREGLGLRARVCHRAQLGLRDLTQVLVVLAAHDAGANQGDTKRCVQRTVLLSLLSLLSDHGLRNAVPESTINNLEPRSALQKHRTHRLCGYRPQMHRPAHVRQTVRWPGWRRTARRLRPTAAPPVQANA